MIVECLREWLPGQPLDQLFDRRLAQDPTFVARGRRRSLASTMRSAFAVVSEGLA